LTRNALAQCFQISAVSFLPVIPEEKIAFDQHAEQPLKRLLMTRKLNEITKPCVSEPDLFNMRENKAKPTPLDSDFIKAFTSIWREICHDSAAMFLRNKWINTFQLSLYLDKWIKTHSEVSFSINEPRKHDARVWRWNCQAEMIASSVFYLWRSFLHFPRHQKALKILSSLQHCKILCRYSWF